MNISWTFVFKENTPSLAAKVGQVIHWGPGLDAVGLLAAFFP